MTSYRTHQTALLPVLKFSLIQSLFMLIVQSLYYYKFYAPMLKISWFFIFVGLIILVPTFLAILFSVFIYNKLSKKLICAYWLALIEFILVFFAVILFYAFGGINSLLNSKTYTFGLELAVPMAATAALTLFILSRKQK